MLGLTLERDGLNRLVHEIRYEEDPSRAKCPVNDSYTLGLYIFI